MITLLSWVCLALLAQTAPAPQFARIQEYLSLSEAQIETLIANVRTQAEERAARARRMEELMVALRVEMAREEAESVTLGGLAVQREEVCREDRSSWVRVTEWARAELTATQRTRLDELESARRLNAAVQEAQSLALLDGHPATVILGGIPMLPGCMERETQVLVPGNTPTFAAKQYLNLSDAQYRVLSENIQNYMITMAPTQGALNDLSRSITLEIVRQDLDQAALGRLYAQLGGVCRSAESYYRELRRAAESILNEPQKTKLATLAASRDSAPTVGEAQRLGLVIGSAVGASSFLVAGIGMFPFLQPVCPIP
ncbi:MAG: hypothetical protein JNK87_20455 [Bryobacterales bacterium]|nr:hypothetical protein [Bryobacterales bacterium]